MDLTKTQKEVLKVLINNKNTPLTPRQITEKSNVQINHVKQALNKFMQCDYVYQPTSKGEFTISPDGEDAYLNSNGVQ